jgi:hypothetical protein
MDKIKRATPEDLWTKQCAPKDPEPIADCAGCPILAVDKKPAREIVSSKIKGSKGDEVSAVEGKLGLLGQDPNDPVTGPITHPNGTFGPTYLLPSIRDEDGNIKDPVQDKEKLTYSPCVGDGTCASASRFMSSTRKSKFAPDLLTDEDSSSQRSSEEPRMQQSRHVPHVDKVEMQDAQLDDGSDADATSDGTPAPANAPKPSDDDSTSSSELEMSATIVAGKDDAAGGFTPAFSDDDASASASKDDTTISTSPSSAAPSSSSTDEPRFTQSKEKKATQSKDSTMEVTEFDENVTGGKKINEDDKPTKEEADDKQ